MDHYVIHIYGLVIHTWNALTLWAFSVFSCIKRCVKSFVGFFQCIAKITNLSYSYHTTITADHTWNEKLKIATSYFSRYTGMIKGIFTFEELLQPFKAEKTCEHECIGRMLGRFYGRVLLKRYQESNVNQYNCYNMKNKKVFLPEVLNTVISLLTSSSVTLPLLMARRVSSRSAPVEINNDQNWHWIIQSSLTKFDNSLLTANQNNEKSCVDEILTKIPKLLLCKMNECSDINSYHICPGHSLPHFALC